MTSEQKEFIELIGTSAVGYYSLYCILPSLTIAQAILESNWGKSKLSKECYNFFGMKWTSGCGCEYKQYQTKEQKKDGSIYTVTACFRKYSSLSEGIKGYYEFLQYARYSNLKKVTDASKACELIQLDGWATSISYATNLKNLIRQFKLTDWDLHVLEPANDVITDSKYEAGKYKVIVDAIRVRKGPGISYRQVKFSEMTKVAQKVNQIKKSTGLAYYVKGITFDALEVIKVSNQEYWAKTPSGYVALMYQGKAYVK